MGIVMYVFDERWPDKEYAPGLHPGKTIRRVIVRQQMTLETVVAQILDGKARAEKMELLRLCAHGDSGGIWLGLGLKTQWTPSLAPLREHFVDRLTDKKVEIHGCGVASDTSILKPSADLIHPRLEDTVPGTFGGQRDRVGFGGQGFMFLLSLAVVTMTRVEGAINVQAANRQFRYFGDSVIVWPDGQWARVTPASRTQGPPLLPDP
jgi:hypothetical protein